MEFLNKVISILDAKMTRPTGYGWFHIMFWAITLASAFVLCFLYKKGIIKNVKRVVLITALTVIALEIYKLFIFGISYGETISYSFVWYIFPWQFCSTPMFIGLLAGLTKGKFHKWMCSFLATYAVFAGTAVMCYPGDVFIDTIGINIQTMVCHGSMLVIGIFLYYTGHVEAKIKTLLRAIPVFASCLTIAVVLNEIAGKIDPDKYNFNLFYISRYHQGTLPVFSLIQNKVPFIVGFIIYVVGFTVLAGVILLIAMGINAICRAIKNARAKKAA